MDSGDTLVRASAGLQSSANTVQLTIGRNVAAWLFALMASSAALAWLQTDKLHRTLELTEVDPFSAADWDSSEAEIWGLHLGMSREAATLTVEKRGLRLLQSGLHYESLPCFDSDVCGVSYSVNNDVGPAVRFGKKGEVTEITVNSVPDYAHPSVRKVAVAGAFKGQMFEFFNGGYSNDMRLKLFGRESGVQSLRGQWGDKAKDTRYIYAVRGVSITVSPRSIADPQPELVSMSLFPHSPAGNLPF